MEENGDRRLLHKGSHSVAFVTGISRYRPGHGARKAIRQQLKSSFQVKKIRIDHNSSGHARGWAWVIFANDSERDRCCEEMKDKLWVPRKNSDERCFLTMSPCLNSKICQAFPTATHEQRMQLLLDPEGSYSITDEHTADSITDACVELLSVLEEGKAEQRRRQTFHVAVDCTAGCGGNTASFIRCHQFQSVISFEQHEQRAAHLDHNMAVLFPPQEQHGQWRIRNENFLTSLCDLKADNIDSEGSHVPDFLPIDLMFLDPPWGGQNYRQPPTPTPLLFSTDESSLPTLSLPLHSLGTLPAHPPPVVHTDYLLGDNSSSLTMQLSHLLSEVIPFQLNPFSSSPLTSNSVKLVGVKLPEIFDLTSLCDLITRSDPRWDQEDTTGNILPSSSPGDRSIKRKKGVLDSRPHPFVFNLVPAPCCC
jgi:hypothetical protein